MCGIAGFVGSGGRSDIERMTRALAHRGPDDEAYYADPSRRVHLGFRRLSILDHAGGKQPMRTEDERLTLVFNGEIYNHRELRLDLEARGHRFLSNHSDTEVLLHGYREWGTDLPVRLNGMFAFAIHDTAGNQIFLARDRFGEKPLFIYQDSELFAFASELASLTAHQAIPRDWNEASLKKYFAYGYFPAPHTPFKRIEKLPAGHAVSLDLSTRKATKSAYWRFRLGPDPALRDEQRLAEELRGHLATAVARRLEADVPLGFLLSGGLDSSAVVALAAEDKGAENLQTYCIAFNEPTFDESAFAQQVADHLGTRHHVGVCDITRMRESLAALLRRIDEPLGDASLVPTNMVCAFAKEHVTVALTGDGGDELFAGYDPVRALAIGHAYRRFIPRGLHAWIVALVGRLPLSDRNMSLDFKLRRALRGLEHEPAFWNPMWMAPLSVSEIGRLFATPVDLEDLYSEAVMAWSECDSANPIDRTSEFFTRLYLQDDILTKSDRASMNNSLELRAPFLDNDLVDYVARLPARMKYHRGTSKRILRTAMRESLPHNIVSRPKKGFGIPLTAWLRDLPQPTTGGLGLPLDETWLAQRWTEHRQRQADWRHALWCWLTLRATSETARTNGPPEADTKLLH